MSILDRLRKIAQPHSGVTDASKDKAALKQPKKAVVQKQQKAATKAVAKTAAKAVVSGARSENTQRVLVRPIVTEKATLTGTYVFEVARSANKTEVKKAIQHAYGVMPAHVRIMNVRGKVVRWNYREGQRSEWKKAIVRLKAGETINVYEGT